MQAENHYETLGIGRSAAPEDVRRAFAEKAKRVHPDLNPGSAWAERSTKALNEAYAVLRDPTRRALYDLRRFGGPERRASPRERFDMAAWRETAETARVERKASLGLNRAQIIAVALLLGGVGAGLAMFS